MKKKFLITLCLMAVITVGGCGKKEVALEPATTEKPVVTLPKPVVEEVLNTVEDATKEVPEQSVSETEAVKSEEFTQEDSFVDNKAILEELVLNTAAMENYKSRIVLDIDMSYAMPEEITNPDSPTLSMSMNIIMKGDIEVNTTKEASSQKGTVETSMFGVSMTIPTENYTDHVNGISYEANYEDDKAVWIKTNIEDTSESNNGSKELIVSIRDSIETGLVTLETTDSEYILHTEISPDAAGTEAIVGTETEESIPIEVHFDKITMLPTRVDMSITSAFAGEEDTEVEMNSAVFYIEFYDYGNASVTIPQEVIDSAIEE